MATATATQEKHPWKAVVRTVLQATIALAAAVPFIVEAITEGDAGQATGALGVFVAVSAAVTRVFALPSVNAFLARFVPWLAPGTDD